MTLAELEQELKKLPLAERAKLLSREQLTDEERDELDDQRDLADCAGQVRIREASAEARAGETRPFTDFVAELEEEERAKRHA